MNIKNYFNVKYVLKIIGLLFILLGLSNGFIDSLTHSQAEDYLHIGIAVLVISYIFVPSFTKTEELAKSMSNDSIVKGSEIWESIASKSSSFYTQRLVKYSNGMIKVRPTLRQILFNLRFILSGLFAILMAFILFAIVESYISILPVVVGGTFLWFGLKNIEQREIVIFDLNKAQFLKKEDNHDRRLIPFTQIHGLQLMQVFNRDSRMNLGDSDMYDSYELNLILKNGDRINIMSHGDKNAIIIDTKKLAAYLSVPIWHKL